jgi:hypothetical protein
MPGKEDIRMSCSEFDALLSQAIDGTLAGDKLASFEAHGRVCQLCGPLLHEAEAGRSWLKSLAELEPPAELVNNILLQTSGVISTQRHVGGKIESVSWTERLRDWAGVIASPIVAMARQPRFAMSFGMAFFTLSVTLSLAGVKLSDLRHMDLRPSAVRRTYYETTGKVVKYYENIRFVYEIESRVRQFKEAATPAERPTEQQNNNDHKNKTKNDSSGQPEQKQERNNYSREGNQPIFASLRVYGGPEPARLLGAGVTEPTVVSVTTYRRFS